MVKDIEIPKTYDELTKSKMISRKNKIMLKLLGRSSSAKDLLENVVLVLNQRVAEFIKENGRPPNEKEAELITKSVIKESL